MTLSNLALVYSAVSRVRAHYLNIDMLAVLKLQAEEVPSLVGMEEEFGCTAFDHSYTDLVHACELEKQRVSAADAEFAARIAREAEFDARNVRIAEEEEQTRLDHELALRIEQTRDEGQIQGIVEEHGRDVIMEPLPADPSEGEVAEPTEGEVAQGGPVCAVCMDEATDAMDMACEHTYCRTCLRGLFHQALKDSSILPVACCQKAIPQEFVQKVLSQEDENILISRLQEKLATSKMYCANPTCSKFIDLNHLTLTGLCLPPRGIFDCVDCGLPLCIHCKSSAAAHGSGPWDGNPEGEEDLVNLAADEGWKRCPGCKTFVLLKSGCNRITCVCGHEFCFECGMRWTIPKPCTCVLFTEEMLMRENERRVLHQQEDLGRDLYAAERANIWHELNDQNQAGEECSHRSKNTLHLREFSRGKTRKPCDNCDGPIPLFVTNARIAT